MSAIEKQITWLFYPYGSVLFIKGSYQPFMNPIYIWVQDQRTRERRVLRIMPPASDSCLKPIEKRWKVGQSRRSLREGRGRGWRTSSVGGAPPSWWLPINSLTNLNRERKSRHTRYQPERDKVKWLSHELGESYLSIFLQVIPLIFKIFESQNYTTYEPITAYLSDLYIYTK